MGKLLYRLFIAILIFSKSSGYGQTIFDAARSNDTLRINTLFHLNPDTVNALSEIGFSPLIIAVYREQMDAAKLLIKLNANVNIQSPEGTSLLVAAYKGNKILVDLILNTGANVDDSNEDGVTSLMYAAQLNHQTVAISLLQFGANKYLRSKAGFTAFDYAMKNGFNSLAEVLLSK
ncbi:MAG: ankyrin repeat domain-containing protein [Bacteroidia bacterium]|jgi:hypothetical protein|nr:ankyrin repeat domain-containing protein [Bacteroidia bacterium]